MAAFLSRTVDTTLRRGSHRAALGQFSTPGSPASLGLVGVGSAPQDIRSDGADLWVANLGAGGSVSRVRSSDGRLLGTWTGSEKANGVLPAMGLVFVVGETVPGKLYRIDPTQPAGAVTTVATNLGGNSNGITFDGGRIWIANLAGSVSIVTPGATLPWTVTTVTTGFSAPLGALFDGSNVWVTDFSGAAFRRLDAAGAILQTVSVGGGPETPAFDGANLWVPNVTDSVAVIRASSGAVLTVLTGNGLDFPFTAAFDGQRIAVTNQLGNSVSLWKAADLTPLGSFPMPASSAPGGICFDGLNFWIALNNPNQIARF